MSAFKAGDKVRVKWGNDPNGDAVPNAGFYGPVLSTDEYGNVGVFIGSRPFCYRADELELVPRADEKERAK